MVVKLQNLQRSILSAMGKAYVLNTGRANKKNSHFCLYSECKIPFVVYAAN